MNTIQKKFLINFVPTGVVPNRKITPYVPLSPEEIDKEVLEMSKLCLHIVHLHVRDYVMQAPTYKGEVLNH
jgi:3-oxoadipate:acetyl-CoA acetyltransferase